MKEKRVSILLKTMQSKSKLGTGFALLNKKEEVTVPKKVTECKNDNFHGEV